MPKTASDTTIETTPQFKLSAICTIVALGILSGCIPALQPILLNMLYVAERLTLAEMGQAAMAEAAGMAISTTIAAIWCKPVHLKKVAAAVLLMAAVANFASAQASGIEIIALRFVNGVSSGILLWLLVGLFARHATPARLFAIYITIQALAALFLSNILTSYIAPKFGFGGGYLTIAVLDVVMIGFALLFMPKQYPTVAQQKGGIPPLHGLIALVGIALFLAGILAFWVYVNPLMVAVGLDAGAQQKAISGSLVGQLAGGLAAIFLATRVKSLSLCLIGTILASASVVACFFIASTSLMILALVLFGFCWMVVPPFQMTFLLEIDRSMRSALLIGSAQLTGVSLGPLLASMFVTEQSANGAMMTAIGLFVVSAVLVVLAKFGGAKNEAA